MFADDIEETDEQVGVRCTIMRGGTSKGIFFMRDDLPPTGARLDRFLKRVMGTPHPMQIDGIGGSNLLTSKIAIIGKPSVPDADIDYTFAQVEIVRDVVDYAGNCGNVSAAVGPFAIDAGLVPVKDGVTEVRIHNTNTGKVFIAHVPVENGRTKLAGSTAIPGVNGTAARILLDYRETTGAQTNSILPTGNRTDRIQLEDGRSIVATICDVANPAAFINPADIGLTGSELPARIDGDKDLLGLLREIRGKAAVMMKTVSDWRRVDDENPLVPFVIMVAEPEDYGGIGGITVKAGDADMRARLMFMNHCHEAMAGTGSMCIAAASRIPGSVANNVLSEEAKARDTLRIGHPSGSMKITVRAKPANRPEGVEFEALGFERTARRIMDGTVYVPLADMS
jgi:2-methylaconitate cis-trans-isomerase PrpF